jgi:formate hydrogenlyase transcriptional activator
MGESETAQLRTTTQVPTAPALPPAKTHQMDEGAVLRAIMEGTAPLTGTAFFRALVKHLCKALDVRYAFVAECLPNLRARSRAFWDGDDFGEDFEYELPGTPCMEVARGRTCHIPDRLPEAFPEDKAMIEMGTRSYLGVPLLDSTQRIIGHLVIFDTKPMPADPLALSVMETFAGRAGAELERAQAYEQLQARDQELRTLLEVNTAIGRHLERDELFGALASCLRELLETDRFGIELPIGGHKLQGHILTPHGETEEPTQPTVLPADGTVCDWVIQNRRWYVGGSRDELRERFPVTFDVMGQEQMESLCALPLATGERCLGALFFMAAQKDAYQGLRRGLLDQVAGAVAVALDDSLAHEEVRQLRDRLAAENVYLQEEIRAEHNFTEIIGNSPKLRAVLRQVDQVAPTDSTVLLYGETGTGKELIARAIHNRSGRKERPLVKVNCGAISAGLVESELFGHVKGAFTGALTNRDGRFKVADGGTIFLDEVGDLPPETQVKLLRVLQEQEFEPIGSDKTVRVDVRIIAATNRNLDDAVRADRFRSDLLYRLNVFPIHIPPLRERPGDIALLVTFFVQNFSKKLGKIVTQVSEDTMRRLTSYSWPGNIRELQNVLERAVILTTGNVLILDEQFQPPATWLATAPAPAATASLKDAERRHIESVLAQAGWVIEGDRGAAKILGLHPNTLRSRMKKLGIRRPAG